MNKTFYIVTNAGCARDENETRQSCYANANETRQSRYANANKGERTLVLPIDEESKTLASVERIWQWLIEQQADRQDIVHAIGGGTLLDTVGFAAATYKRGIRWISEPTTLLSMVDAGTGGKTGVNYGGVKNAVGCFWPPEEVIIRMDYLDTLPGEEILSGYAEMVKHKLIDHRTIDHLPFIGQLPEPFSLTEEDIHHSIAIKQYYVEQDPTEQGIRKALNLGHTIGHALEALSLGGLTPGPLSPKGKEGAKVQKVQEVQGVQSLREAIGAIDSIGAIGTIGTIGTIGLNGSRMRHGYAVMYGLAAELYLSHIRLGLDKQIVSTIAHLITEYYGRPNVSCKRYDELIDLMRQDKKGSLNFTLLEGIGKPIINQILTEQEIKEALDYLFTI